MSKDGKAIMESGDRVVCSTMDMFVEQPDVRGIFSHYDEKDGRPHILIKNATEYSLYGRTRKFDLVRLDNEPLETHKDTSCSSNGPIWTTGDLEYLQNSLKEFKKKRDKTQTKLKIYDTAVSVIEHEINKLNGVKY